MEPFFLENYKLWLARKFRPHSVINCLSAIKRFFKIYDELSYENLDAFIQEYKNTGKSESHQYSMVLGARNYVKFLRDSHHKFDERILKYPYPVIHQTYKSILSDEEIEAMINLKCPSNNYLHYWDKMSLFFQILAYTGMRPNELASLKHKHLDFGRKIFILEPEFVKTKDLRYVPIASNLIEPLKNFIKDKKQDDLLFTSHHGRKLKRSYWGFHFRKRVRILGIQRPKLSTYSFRHTLATRLLEEDCNLFKVQKLLGHKRIETTNLYTHLTTKDLHNAIMKLPILRNKLNPLDTLRVIKEFIQSLNLDSRFNLTMEDKGNKLKVEVEFNATSI